jgi:ATP-binding cassette subfamily B protein
MNKQVSYPKVTLKDILAAYWRGIRPQKWALFLLIFSVIAANVVSIVVPLQYKQFFDVLSRGGDKASLATVLLHIIITVGLLNAVFWAFYRVAYFSNNAYVPKTTANLKQQAYDYTIRHSYSFFANSFTGSLVQRVNRFARAFERLSDNILWNLMPLLVRIISIIVVVFFINKFISLILLAWIAIFLGFNIGFSKWKLAYDIKSAEIDSKTTAYLSDTITNQNTISLFARFSHESAGYKKITTAQANMTRFVWNLDAFIDGGQALLSFAIQFILFYVAIVLWRKNLITVGVFFLLEIYLINIIDQLWGFTRIVRDLYQSYADSKEMVEIMALPHEIQDVPTAQELSVLAGSIEFQDLTFQFNQTRTILDDIHLVIEPGQRVALIGPSGAGKSTFVRLLLRLYTPTSGKILIDGQDVAHVTQESLRKNISLVPQDPILFHRTLAENISYGKADATRYEIEQAAKLAHCDEFISHLPLGLETLVGERGIKLSGGERQRIAIARAILKNAPILILDEATSSLDSHSETLIQDALKYLMQGKTTIVIAHRLSTIQHMNRIIVIDDGKIVEEGSHTELLQQKNSLYKKLWTLQAGGFLQEDDSEKDSLDQEKAGEELVVGQDSPAPLPKP